MQRQRAALGAPRGAGVKIIPDRRARPGLLPPDHLLGAQDCDNALPHSPRTDRRSVLPLVRSLLPMTGRTCTFRSSSYGNRGKPLSRYGLWQLHVSVASR
jgi:hypothetical protein